MELICPSCEARYELPPGAIPDEGRQVSCQACGHSWHALPEIALGAAAAAPASAPSPSKGLQWQGAGGKPAPASGPPPLPPHLTEEPDWAAGDVDETPKATGHSSEQLSQIRQMLEEMQSEERRGAPASHASRAQFSDPADTADDAGPAPRYGDTDEDAFRSRLNRVTGGTAKTKPVDVRRLRRSHDRRVSRKKHAKQAGSGMFATSFLLIAIVAATMVSLYVLHPQIIAKMPESEAAMVQYVSAIDSMRASFNETFSGTIEWVNKRLDQNVEQQQ